MTATDTAAASLLIGELADRVGVNAKTIRYYEDVGLLPEPDRTASGYRVYAQDDVERLQFIRRAQQLDLRLDEISEILALRDQGQVPCDYVQSVARRRVSELDERIAEMQRARDELRALLDPARLPTTKAATFCPLVEHSASADDRDTDHA